RLRRLRRLRRALRAASAVGVRATSMSRSRPIAVPAAKLFVGKRAAGPWPGPCIVSMSMSKRLVSSTLLVVLVSAAGCLTSPLGKNFCTQADAPDGLIVDVSVTGGALPPDAYTIVAQAEGAEIRDDNEIIDAGSSQTSQPADVVVQGKHVYLEAARCAGRGTITVGYREGAGPATITLEVRRGATVLAHQSYTPTYSEFMPNGPDCEPTVLQAHGTMTIAAP